MSDIVKELLEVILRAFISLVTLFLVTKILGKKQVSQLSLFDYVIGISIGNFAAEMTLNLDSHWLHATVAVLFFGIVAYLIAILTMKSIVLRRIFIGKPTIIIDNGKLLEKNLKQIKYNINDLLEQCRMQGYFDLSTISFAVMEVNGVLSILPKDKYKPVIKKDMNLKKEPVGLLANVIIDGKIMEENLKNINKNKDWVIKETKKRQKEISNILLATVDVNDSLVIYEKGMKLSKDILE